MPIVPADIAFRLSITTGGAGNSAPQPDPAQSLGRFVSTTAVAAGTGGLFGDVSGTDNEASAVDYRCVFVVNTHPSLTLVGAKVWVQDEVPGGANIAVAVDAIAPSAIGASSAQAAQIANAANAPTGVGAFSTPTTAAAGLALGDLGPGQCRAVWVRRTATNSAALNLDSATLAVAGDTAA